MNIQNSFILPAGVSTPFGVNNQAVDMFGRKQRNAGPGVLPFRNGQTDPVEQKRALAKKQAYKMVSDTFATERRADDMVKESQESIGRSTESMGEAKRKIKEIREEQEKLRLEYGVEADSQEQKDMEILEVYNQGMEAWLEMSDEDLKRARELDAQGYAGGYTEYQQRALGVSKGIGGYKEDIKNAQKAIIEENAAIREMTIERLKHHPMVDAVKEADDILENASKEIVGMLTDEAVDSMDEKFEEEIEEAEENKEEKKEEEEKIEAAKEHREEMEALANPEKAGQEYNRADSSPDILEGDPVTEALLKMDKVKTDIQQEVSDMVMKMNLVADDIKGIKVDELL